MTRALAARRPARRRARPEVWTGRATNRFQWLLAARRGRLHGARHRAGRRLHLDVRHRPARHVRRRLHRRRTAGPLRHARLRARRPSRSTRSASKCAAATSACRAAASRSRTSPAPTSRPASPRASGAAGATAGGRRRAPRSSCAGARAWCCGCGTATRSRSPWTTRRRPSAIITGPAADRRRGRGALRPARGRRSLRRPGGRRARPARTRDGARDDSALDAAGSSASGSGRGQARQQSRSRPSPW